MNDNETVRDRHTEGYCSPFFSIAFSERHSLSTTHIQTHTYSIYTSI